MRKIVKILLILCLIIPFVGQGASNVDELKQDLENQIKQKQEEIDQYQQKIGETQQQSGSLRNEIQILENEISKFKAEINQIDLVIQKSTLNIREIDGQISSLISDMNEKRDLLAEYIRIVARYDQETLLEVVLKNNKFSDFFDEINAFESVQDNIQTTLAIVQALRDDLEDEREEIESEREEQNRLKSLQLIQKNSIESRQWQKEDLLDKTKGQEAAYQNLVKGKEQEISYIKEQLSLLERYNITLEEAVADAIFAASKTGIRPAFLLGVLEAESRLGLNVGTGTWKKDMYQCYRSLGYISKAEREKNAFFSICEGLGLNPDTQPVSAEPWYGCGGAMGVGQFMPTTWLAYRDRVAALTGNNPPNPWVHKDAFMASAIKLSEGGANQRTEMGERTAYAKYLGGSNYKKWIYHNVTTYVINLTANFQKQYFQ
ncbi:MAG: lytic murein transglycosylase [Candidatus Portnoybacteria bacterium]